MSTLDGICEWVAARLPELLAEHRVPGAAVAISAGGEIVEHAAGVLNTATGVEATVDSVFQIGSITKVWTAALVLQLADEGRLDLDAPIRAALPEFRLADDTAAARITPRQVLCHTAGFAGDLAYGDTGVGDDCLRLFVDLLGDAHQLFPPGAMFSYSNAGYCLLGRLVEVLRGTPYDECLRAHLAGPLGLTHVAPSPYQAVRFRVACGHVDLAPGADPVPAPIWALPRSGSPAGAMLAMCPRDLVTFALVASGQSMSDRPSVLGASGLAAMRQRHVDLPYLGGMPNAWGLGWGIFDWPGGTVLGHDGGTIGQDAYLRVVPDRGVAVALCANGGSPRPLYREIVGRVFGELAGVDIPADPAPDPTRPVADASRYLGRYSSNIAETTVSQDADGRIWADEVPKGMFAAFGIPPARHELVACRDDTLVSADQPSGRHLTFTFVGADPGSHARFLHTGRADPWTGR